MFAAFVAIALGGACSSSNSESPGGSGGSGGSGTGGSGGSGSSPDGGAKKVTKQVVGKSGGTVSAPNGTKVIIPAGALPADVTISVQENPSAPQLTTAQSVGASYLFGPEGQKFLKTVSVTLPVTNLPQGSTAQDLVMYTAPAGTSDYKPLPTTVEDATHVTGKTNHFCNMQLGLAAAAGDGGIALDAAGADATVGAPSDGGSTCGEGVSCSAGDRCQSTTVDGPSFTCSCVKGAYACVDAGFGHSAPDAGRSAGDAAENAGHDSGAPEDVGVGADAPASSCSQGATCFPNSSCGGSTANGGSFRCTCVGGAYDCVDGGAGGAPDGGQSGAEAGAEIDAGVSTCSQGALCSAGTGCAYGSPDGGSVTCTCVKGRYSCS